MFDFHSGCEEPVHHPCGVGPCTINAFAAASGRPASTRLTKPSPVHVNALLVITVADAEAALLAVSCCE